MRKDKSTLSRNTHNHRSQSNWHEHLHAQSFCTRKQISSQSFCVYVFFFVFAPNNLHRYARRFVLFHHSFYQILLSTRIKFITIQSIGFGVLLFVPRQFWHGRLIWPGVQVSLDFDACFAAISSISTHYFSFFVLFGIRLFSLDGRIEREKPKKSNAKNRMKRKGVCCIIIISRHCKSHIYYRDLTEAHSTRSFRWIQPCSTNSIASHRSIYLMCCINTIGKATMPNNGNITLIGLPHSSV